MLENGELFVLPTASSAAAEVELKLSLVGVRDVSCPSELQARPQHATHPSPSLPAPPPPLPTLQAGAPHALFIELSPVPRSREGWQGVGACVKLVLVAESAEEQAEWQTCLDRVATAYRNWRRVSDAPGVVLGGLKSVGNLALHAAGTGFGWEVGRDAGRAASRALGL